MGRELRPWWLRIGRIIYIRFKALSIYIGLCDYVCLYCIYRTIYLRPKIKRLEGTPALDFSFWKSL